MKIERGNKILLIPQDGLGDNLMFLPLAYHFSPFKDVKIHCLSNKLNGASQIMRQSPYINKVIEFSFQGSIYTVKEYLLFFIFRFIHLIRKLKKENYDYVFVINPNLLIKSILFFFNKDKKIVNFNKKMNQTENGLSLLQQFDNIILNHDYKDLLIYKDEEKVLNKFELQKQDYILLNCYGTTTAKSNSESELAHLLNTHLKSKHKIVQIGQYEHHIRNTGIIDLVNQTSLEEVAVIIKNAYLFITVDGGLMHIGIAHHVPIIALFKVIHSKYLKPINKDYPYFRAFDERNEDASFEDLKRNINSNSEIKMDEKDILREIVNYVENEKHF